MSQARYSDLREDQFIYNLYCLQNAKIAKDKEEENRAIANLKALIHKKNSQELIKQSLLSVFADTNGKVGKELENKLDLQIANLCRMNDALSAQDCQPLLQTLHEEKTSTFKKNVAYTKYLLACEAYHAKSGEKPAVDVAQTIHTDRETETRPAHGSAPVAPAPLIAAEKEKHGPEEHIDETAKPPIFIDEKQYENGNIKTFHGISLAELIAIQKDIVAQMNADPKTAGKITFSQDADSCTVTSSETDVHAKYEELVQTALKKKHFVIAHSEKTEDKMPEKTKAPAQDTSLVIPKP